MSKQFRLGCINPIVTKERTQDTTFPFEMDVVCDAVSDGYHTMSELYEHRMALNSFLFRMMYELDKQVRGWRLANKEPLIMKSKLHNDGTMFEGGYFIVMAKTERGQISYHYDLKYWNNFKIPEVERIPFPYDGHTPQDCIDRLLKL